MDWPLLPPQGAVLTQQSQEPHLVTLQELQLAVCGLAYVARTGAPTAALNMALLLQQADPGLRAEFLGGPGGSALLSSCLYWGYHDLFIKRPPQSGDWKNFGLVSVVNEDSVVMLNRMWGALVGEDMLGWPASEVLPAPTSVGLVLAWCHLQLPLGWEQQQQQQQQQEGGAKQQQEQEQQQQQQQPLPHPQQQQQQEGREEEQEDVADGQGPRHHRLVATRSHVDLIKQFGCGQGKHAEPPLLKDVHL
jgi:hypothetical protein